MKHSAAQHYLDRISRNLYDDSPEKAAILAAARALKFAHSLGCHQGPVSIPVQTLFSKVGIELEPETVILPPLADITKNMGAPHADADAVDQGSASVDSRHDATRGVA